MGRVTQAFKPPILTGWQIFAPRQFVQGLHVEENRAQAALFARGNEQGLALVAEPTNTYDPNAILVVGRYRGWFMSGLAKLGYVPRDIAEALVTTGLLPKVMARLKFVTVGETGGDVEFEIVGPKEHKRAFDSFFEQKLNSGPPSDDQKEFAWFFGPKLPRGVTFGQAQTKIDARKSQSPAERLKEWNAYWSICEELDDEDNRESYFIKAISRKILRAATDDLKKEAKPLEELAADPQEVVDRILKTHPNLERA
jgi:hypothetical protein